MKVRLIAENDDLTVIGERIGDASNIVDASFRVGAGQFLPGLINAHDHLHRNHYPRLGSPPYANAYAWGSDLHSRFASDLALAGSLPRGTALLFGAFKNIIGGATTVVHHDRWEPMFDCDFPLRIPRIRAAHSLRLEPDLDMLWRSAGSAPMTLHLAEGSDAASADEIRQADERGFLSDRLLAVHGIGADADGMARLRRSGAALVWCPTSNEFLYHRGVRQPLDGIDVLVGTDALVSGAGTILHELNAARRIALLSDDRLVDAVGAAAARRLGLPKPSLSPGANADLILLRVPVLDAHPRDVALVIIGGKPQLADAALAGIFDIAGVAYEPMTVGGATKVVAAPLVRAAREVFALTPECRRIVA